MHRAVAMYLLALVLHIGSVFTMPDVDFTAPAVEPDRAQFEAMTSHIEDQLLVNNLSLVLSDFIGNVAHIAPPFRNCVEVFGGEGCTSEKLQKMGLIAVNFDKKANSNDSFYRTKGLL